MLKTTKDALVLFGGLGMAAMGAVCCPLIGLGSYHVWLWPSITFIGVFILIYWLIKNG